METIEALREKLQGLPPSIVAKHSGLSRTYIRAIRDGNKANPSIKALSRLKAGVAAARREIKATRKPLGGKMAAR